MSRAHDQKGSQVDPKNCDPGETGSQSSGSMDVSYLAHLARIALSQEEVALFQAQLGRVLEYVEQLKELDVSSVEPTAHAVPVDNIFRLDEPREGLEKTAALANAPHVANGLFVVTKVVE